MLDLAINNAEELQKCFRSIWFHDKYKFWNFTSYYEDMEITDSTWSKHQFVSLDSSGEVIGYIGYEINSSSGVVDGLNIINFTDNKATFGMDAGQALRDIFEKFHFRKLVFVVIIGNTIEKTYDWMIARYGGRSIQRRQVKLIDGQFYDVKMYEILLDDFSGGNGHVRKMRISTVHRW